MNKAYLRDALLVAGGLTLGSGVTFVVTKKVLENKFEDRLADEVADIRRSYKKAAELREVKGFKVENVFVKIAEPELEDVSEPVDEVLSEYGSDSIVQNEPESGTVVRPKPIEDDEIDEEQRELENSAEARMRLGQQRVHNIFKDPREEHPMGNDEEVRPERNTDKPYLISVDEYMKDERDYAKITVTYFEKDETLMDEREEILPDILATVGDDFFNHFGEESQDPNIVYIRNEQLKVDFEVMKDEGSYGATILGMDDEPFEPIKKRNRKSRDDD